MKFGWRVLQGERRGYKRAPPAGLSLGLCPFGAAHGLQRRGLGSPSTSIIRYLWASPFRTGISAVVAARSPQISINASLTQSETEATILALLSLQSNPPQLLPPDPQPEATRHTRPAAMDLDIEMDVDGDDIQDIQPIPEAYTHDIITGEEQVRINLAMQVPFAPNLLTPSSHRRSPGRLTNQSVTKKMQRK